MNVMLVSEKLRAKNKIPEVQKSKFVWPSNWAWEPKSKDRATASLVNMQNKASQIIFVRTCYSF